jgi:hypothetical protein
VVSEEIVGKGVGMQREAIMETIMSSLDTDSLGVLVQCWQAILIRTWSLRLRGRVDNDIPIRNE